MEQHHVVKPKRKYTKKIINPVVEPVVKPVVEPVIEPVVKPKRKYTKKVKAEPVVEPLIEPVIEPVVEPVIEPVVKPKRKYTKKVKLDEKPKSEENIKMEIAEKPIKAKRKYTKKMKPSASPLKPKDASPLKPEPIVKTKIIRRKKTDIKTNEAQLELMQQPVVPVAVVPITKPESPISKKEISATEQKIEEFKSKGFSVLEKFSRQDLEEIIRVCKDAYYNKSAPLLTDNEYDIVEDYYKTKWPADIAVGAPVIAGKNKVQLPYKMASMDKIKPDSAALANWMKTYKGPYLLSCKLDGVSGLYMCNDKGEHRLYTRGDGTIGQDISHLIRPLRLPKLPKNTAIRGEFIMPKQIFETKYKSAYANARNLVSGMVNRKGVDDKVDDLHYVTYEVIQPPMKPSEQLLFVKQLGCRVVQNQMVDTLSNEYLSATLVDWRSNYDYEIDGVIVTDNYIYPRVDGNPEHAFAFKMVLSDQVAEAKVVDVIWTPSKDGYLKPRVRIEPVQLAGVRIEYATGFNGKFIQDNKIGLGAIITLVRSGDVIPYIKSVTSPADQPLMPKEAYTWTDTMVDIILENGSENRVVLEKNITNFFVSLEVDGLSSGNVKRLMDSGLMSIRAILQAKKEDFLRVDGFKQKMVDKIYDSIQEKVSKASLVDIVVASGKLGRGFGKKKVAPVFDKWPGILTTSKPRDAKIQMLREVEGIGPESAREFAENIPEVLTFLHECDLEHKLFEKAITNKPVVQVTSASLSPFSGKKVVLTKTRDKDVISFIEKSGGIIEDNMKKDVFMLIVKAAGDKSSKVDYAEKNGIPVVSVDEFKAKYL